MEVETATGVSDCKLHLQFYLAIHKLAVETILQTKKVFVHTYAGPGKGYIGLRATPEDALERAQCVFRGKVDVNKASFDMLVIRFSGPGVAKYTTNIENEQHHFCSTLYSSTLYKLTYPNDSSGRDYGS